MPCQRAERPIPCNSEHARPVNQLIVLYRENLLVNTDAAVCFPLRLLLLTCVRMMMPLHSEGLRRAPNNNQFGAVAAVAVDDQTYNVQVAYSRQRAQLFGSSSSDLPNIGSATNPNPGPEKAQATIIWPITEHLVMNKAFGSSSSDEYCLQLQFEVTAVPASLNGTALAPASATIAGVAASAPPANRADSSTATDCIGVVGSTAARRIAGLLVQAAASSAPQPALAAVAAASSTPSPASAAASVAATPREIAASDTDDDVVAKTSDDELPPLEGVLPSSPYNRFDPETDEPEPGLCGSGASTETTQPSPPPPHRHQQHRSQFDRKYWWTDVCSVLDGSKSDKGNVSAADSLLKNQFDNAGGMFGAVAAGAGAGAGAGAAAAAAEAETGGNMFQFHSEHSDILVTNGGKTVHVPGSSTHGGYAVKTIAPLSQTGEGALAASPGAIGSVDASPLVWSIKVDQGSAQLGYEHTRDT